METLYERVTSRYRTDQGYAHQQEVLTTSRLILKSALLKLEKSEVKYKELYYSFGIYLETLDSMTPGLIDHLNQVIVDLGNGEISVIKAYDLVQISPYSNFNNKKLLDSTFKLFADIIWPTIMKETESLIK